MNQKKAFTLIELLAVIVVLTLIALISVPIVLKVIEKARKNAFLSTAYGLIESAKLTYTENLMNGKTGRKKYTYPFDDLKFSGSKPNGGMIVIDEFGSVEIAIHNNQWCASKSKMDDKVTLIDYEIDHCLILDNNEDPVIILNGESEIILKLGESYKELGAIGKTISGNPLEYTIEIMKDGQVVDKIDTNLIGHYVITYQVKSNGKIATVSRNVVIKKTKTFVEVMHNSKETASLDPDQNLRYVGNNPNNYVKFNNELWRVIGVFDGFAKIIREEPYGVLAWDINKQNDWSTSSLQVELNTTFFGNFDKTSKSYIHLDHIWNLGGIENAKYVRSNVYQKERGNEVYIGRPTTWSGAVGLMYLSDLGYATSSSDSCSTESMYYWNQTNNESCRNNAWLYDSVNRQWTLTIRSNYDTMVVQINETGLVNASDTNVKNKVNPVIYLKSNIEIQSGLGTKERPFELILS